MLEKHGYHIYKSEDNHHNPIHIKTYHWSRILNYEYPTIPKCNTNQKIALKIIQNITSIDNIVETTFEISITANLKNCWTDLKIYSLSEIEFEKIGIKNIEANMVKIWEITHSTFNN